MKWNGPKLLVLNLKFIVVYIWDHFYSLSEIIEFIVKPNSKITKSPIRDLNFPKTANISGVIRDGIGIIPFGNFQLKVGDKAIVFSLTESIHKIETYFQ